ncbi:MAG: peroxiredoxin [Deltaproteobacteria bacterium]|nr:peroxiredoxin [Deltaproteobacteria bacterium]
MPSWSLDGDDGVRWSSSSLAGSRYVLYFYPRDATPGCTVEACDFRDRHAAFEAAGVRVFGISSDTLASHAKFRAAQRLPFTLLSDPERAVASAFGVVGEKSMYGRKTIGVIRSTFVIGPDGRVEHAWSPVRVAGHAEAVRMAAGA